MSGSGPEQRAVVGARNWNTERAKGDCTMKVFAICGLASFAVFVASVAAADPLPQQKVGLWLQNMTTMGQHITSQFCIDAATQAKMSAFSSSMAHSDKCHPGPIVHGADGSWTNVNTCEFRPGAKRTTRAAISGDFNSKLTMTLTSLPDGATIMTSTSTWAGPCKPGQRGGDVIMSNGMKMNMLDSANPGKPGATPH
jgi:hypothetical protein